MRFHETFGARAGVAGSRARKQGLAGVALAAAAVLAAGSVRADVLGAAYDYAPGFSEDFDQLGLATVAPGPVEDPEIGQEHTYWSVVGNGTNYTESLTVAPALAGGTANAGYNAGAEEGDRHLAIYRTGTGETSFLTVRFRNATGAPLNQIDLLYDLEAAWTRYAASENARDAAFVVQFSTNNAAWQTMPGFGAGVNNANVELDMARTWLTDSEMDALGLSVRGAGGSYPLPEPVAEDGDFYIRWYSVGVAAGRHINIGVDNLRIPAAESALVITDVTVTVDPNTGERTVTLQWDSTPGAFYVVEFSNDLVEWVELGDPVPSGGLETEYIDTPVPAENERRFYRVREM